MTYELLEQLENEFFKGYQKHKNTIVMYSYDFSDFEINKIIHNYIKNAKHSPSAKNLIGILTGLGQIAIGNLYTFGGLYFLSNDYLKKYHSETIVRHLRKLIEPWLISKGNNITKKANTYDFLGIYNKAPKLRNKGVFVNPFKFQKLIFKFFEKYSKNNSIKHISFKKFQRDLKEIISQSKLNIKSGIVIHNKEFSKLIQKVNKKENKENNIFEPIFNAKNPLEEEFEKFKLQNILIPYENYIDLKNEINATREKFYFLFEQEEFEEHHSAKLKAVEKKLNRLYRDFYLYNLNDPNIVTIKNKKYIKAKYKDNYSKKTGRNYHIIASTSKVGRKILFKDYYSIDISNMAGKAIFDIATNIIDKSKIPTFTEYALKRDYFFKKINISLPTKIKNTLLKQMFLSTIFGRDMNKIYNMLVQNKNPHYVKSFKKSIKDLIFEIEPERVDEYFDIFINDIVAYKNVEIISKFMRDVKIISEVIDEYFGNNYNEKNKKKELSTLFMLAESELIEDVLSKINSYLGKYPLKAYRIHDEIIIPKIDKNIIDIIVKVFSNNSVSIKSKKFLLKSFKSSVTQISTGKKLNFDDLNIKTLKEAIIEDFNFYKINPKIKSLLEVSKVEVLSISKDFKYDIKINAENKIKKILNKTLISITENDIKILNDYIKNIENKNKIKFFKRILSGFKGFENPISKDKIQRLNPIFNFNKVNSNLIHKKIITFDRILKSNLNFNNKKFLNLYYFIQKFLIIYLTYKFLSLNLKYKRLIC